MELPGPPFGPVLLHPVPVSGLSLADLHHCAWLCPSCRYHQYHYTANGITALPRRGCISASNPQRQPAPSPLITNLGRLFHLYQSTPAAAATGHGLQATSYERRTTQRRRLPGRRTVALQRCPCPSSLLSLPIGGYQRERPVKVVHLSARASLSCDKRHIVPSSLASWSARNERQLDKTRDLLFRTASLSPQNSCSFSCLWVLLLRCCVYVITLFIPALRGRSRSSAPPTTTSISYPPPPGFRHQPPLLSRHENFALVYRGYCILSLADSRNRPSRSVTNGPCFATPPPRLSVLCAGGKRATCDREVGRQGRDKKYIFSHGPQKQNAKSTTDTG